MLLPFDSKEKSTIQRALLRTIIVPRGTVSHEVKGVEMDEILRSMVPLFSKVKGYAKQYLF